MMKRLLTVLSIVTAAFTGAVNADTWRLVSTGAPPGVNTAVSLSSLGTLTVSKGITLNCNLSGGGTVLAGGATARVDSLAFTPGSFLCPLISFSGLPSYPLVGSGTNTVQIQNVVVTAITGSCAGTLTGTIVQPPSVNAGQINFAGATLPTTTGGSNCTITGTVSTSPAVYFTIP